MPEGLVHLERPPSIDVLVRGEAMFGRVFPKVRSYLVQPPDRGLFGAVAQGSHEEHDVVGESDARSRRELAHFANQADDNERGVGVHEIFLRHGARGDRRSPILGAGLYVDNGVGAAGSTGRGETNLFNLSSFLVIENLRHGMTPKDAGIDALKRIKDNTVEKRLLNPRGLPGFNVNFYVLNAKGEYAGVSMYPSKFAVCTENGAQTVATEALLSGMPTE